MHKVINVVDESCPIHGIPLQKLGPYVHCKECIRNEFPKQTEKSKYPLQQSNNSQKVINPSQLGIPERHISSSFENYKLVYTIQKDVFDHVVDFTNMIRNGSTQNLIMVGREGTGKTHLACAILKLIAKDRRVKYINSFDLSSLFVENWRNTNFFEKNEIERFGSYDLLVIDEYGLYDQKDSHKEYVDKVLLKRYELKKPTVILSNLKKEELKDKLGFRLWSRLNQDGVHVLEFIWKDFRIA